MPRIDMHAHFNPPELHAAVLRALGPGPTPPWSADAQLAVMDRYGIDASVVSVPPPGVHLGDAAQARELARTANEAGADLARRHPGRFAVLAALPLPDVDAALEELEHALDALCLDGVMLLTHAGDTYLGDPAWDPVFDELERRRAYVFVHPNLLARPAPLPHLPQWLLEFPFETTRAVTNLLYSGTLARCPNVRLQLPHQGGTVPFLSGRIASLPDRSPPQAGFRERAPEGAAAYLGRLYYDTGLSNNAVALASTRALAGFSRIVFGTDWPYADLPPAGPRATDPAPGLGFLSPEERRGLDFDHAAALVPRLHAALSAQEPA